MCDEFLNNQATLMADGVPESNSCDLCGDPLMFAMQDRYHRFSLGLLDVLKCLRVAEKEGYVPERPYNWWNKVHLSYHCPVFDDGRDQ